MPHLKDHTLRRIYIFFLVIFALIVAGTLLALRSISHAQASSDWVNHTYSTIYELENIQSSLFAGEGAGRTYVITGNARDLADAREAFSVLNDHCETAKALLRDNAAASRQLQQIIALAGQREGITRALIQARDANQTDRVRELLQTDAGDNAKADIKRGLAKLSTEQFDLLGAQDHASYMQAQTTRWTVSLGMGLDLLLFAAVAWLIRDNLAARNRLAANLQETNAKLEEKVLMRTRDLSRTNAELSAENLERQWTNQALEHQLHYNQVIINSVDDLIFVVTKALNITRINPAVTRGTGLEEKALLGKPLGAALGAQTSTDPAGAELSASLMQSLREGRDLLSHPVSLRDLRGKMLSCQLNFFPLRDDNKVVGGVAILRAAPGGSTAGVS